MLQEFRQSGDPPFQALSAPLTSREPRCPTCKSRAPKGCPQAGPQRVSGLRSHKHRPHGRWGTPGHRNRARGAPATAQPTSQGAQASLRKPRPGAQPGTQPHLASAAALGEWHRHAGTDPRQRRGRGWASRPSQGCDTRSWRREGDGKSEWRQAQGHLTGRRVQSADCVRSFLSPGCRQDSGGHRFLPSTARFFFFFYQYELILF